MEDAVKDDDMVSLARQPAHLPCDHQDAQEPQELGPITQKRRHPSIATTSSEAEPMLKRSRHSEEPMDSFELGELREPVGQRSPDAASIAYHIHAIRRDLNNQFLDADMLTGYLNLTSKAELKSFILCELDAWVNFLDDRYYHNFFYTSLDSPLVSLHELHGLLQNEAFDPVFLDIKQHPDLAKTPMNTGNQFDLSMWACHFMRHAKPIIERNTNNFTGNITQYPSFKYFEVCAEDISRFWHFTHFLFMGIGNDVNLRLKASKLEINERICLFAEQFTNLESIENTAKSPESQHSREDLRPILLEKPELLLRSEDIPIDAPWEDRLTHDVEWFDGKIIDALKLHVRQSPDLTSTTPSDFTFHSSQMIKSDLNRSPDQLTQSYDVVWDHESNSEHAEPYYVLEQQGDPCNYNGLGVMTTARTLGAAFLETHQLAEVLTYKLSLRTLAGIEALETNFELKQRLQRFHDPWGTIRPLSAIPPDFHTARAMFAHTLKPSTNSDLPPAVCFGQRQITLPFWQVMGIGYAKFMCLSPVRGCILCDDACLEKPIQCLVTALALVNDIEQSYEDQGRLNTVQNLSGGDDTTSQAPKSDGKNDSDTDIKQQSDEDNDDLVKDDGAIPDLKQLIEANSRTCQELAAADLQPFRPSMVLCPSESAARWIQKMKDELPEIHIVQDCGLLEKSERDRSTTYFHGTGMKLSNWILSLDPASPKTGKTVIVTAIESAIDRYMRKALISPDGEVVLYMTDEAKLLKGYKYEVKCQISPGLIKTLIIDDASQIAGKGEVGREMVRAIHPEHCLLLTSAPFTTRIGDLCFLLSLFSKISIEDRSRALRRSQHAHSYKELSDFMRVCNYEGGITSLHRDSEAFNELTATLDPKRLLRKFDEKMEIENTDPTRASHVAPVTIVMLKRTVGQTHRIDGHDFVIGAGLPQFKIHTCELWPKDSAKHLYSLAHKAKFGDSSTQRDEIPASIRWTQYKSRELDIDRRLQHASFMGALENLAQFNILSTSRIMQAWEPSMKNEAATFLRSVTDKSTLAEPSTAEEQFLWFCRSSPKIAYASRLLAEIIGEQKAKVVMYVEWPTTMFAAAAAFSHLYRVAAVQLDMPAEQRDSAIRHFHDTGPCGIQLLIMSSRSAAQYISLQRACCHSIIMDVVSCSTVLQIASRTHGFGQTREQHIYQLQCLGTFDTALFHKHAEHFISQLVAYSRRSVSVPPTVLARMQQDVRQTTSAAELVQAGVVDTMEAAFYYLYAQNLARDRFRYLFGLRSDRTRAEWGRKTEPLAWVSIPTEETFLAGASSDLQSDARTWLGAERQQSPPLPTSSPRSNHGSNQQET